jgi:hypothetical protein
VTILLLLFLALSLTDITKSDTLFITAPIITNSNMGWFSLINQNYVETNEIPDNIFLSSSNTDTIVSNESINMKKGLVWDLNSPFTGNLYIGQLYPAGHSLYRINMSIEKDKGTPDITLKFGNLIYLNVQKLTSDYKITLYYYNETGSLLNDKNYSIRSPYADISIEYFPNGTANVYDSHDSTKKRLLSREHLNWVYPYSYLSPTIIEASVWKSSSNRIKVIFYSFEQKMPEKIITILPDNKNFPFGFDGPRPNYLYGINWLKNHKQRATIWADVGVKNKTSINEISDLINNHGFELGIHFSQSLSLLTWDEAKSTIESEIIIISNNFNHSPTSWCSLQNKDNFSHAEYIWKNYNIVWRNTPNSIKAFSNIGNIYSDVMYFWRAASSHSSFIPAYTHSVSDPPEGYSLSQDDFEEIMTNYSNRGIKIVPYSEWYYTNLNTIENISDIFFNETKAQLVINTHGYKATTLIHDPYSSGVWFSDEGGKVKNLIDNLDFTKLEIITNKSEKIRKLPMHVKTPKSSYLSINEYSISRINFTMETITGENSTLTLCNLIPGNKYQVSNANNISFEKMPDDKGCMDFEEIGENKNNYYIIESKNNVSVFKDIRFVPKPKALSTRVMILLKEWLMKWPTMLVLGIFFIAISINIVLYFSRNKI